MVEVKVSLAGRVGEASVRGPLRLVAQDIGFSAREQGFDSPRGYYGQLYTIARIRNALHKPLIVRGLCRFLRNPAILCRWLLHRILHRHCTGFRTASDRPVKVGIGHLQVVSVAQRG